MIDQTRLDWHLVNGEIERVMCAANYHNDGIDYAHQPFNIDKGFIIAGWRRGNVGASYLAANKEAKNWHGAIQGFLTTKNRFLTRAEALELVRETGQLTKPLLGGQLTSEDLW